MGLQSLCSPNSIGALNSENPIIENRGRLSFVVNKCTERAMAVVAMCRLRAVASQEPALWTKTVAEVPAN